MSLSDYLHPTDHRLPEGWPNPRALMTNTACMRDRMAEDRIMIGYDVCTPADLTRLGWLPRQVDIAGPLDILDRSGPSWWLAA